MDLSHGQREFLTRELAEDALAPLLADGSAVTRVRVVSTRGGLQKVCRAFSAGGIRHCAVDGS